MTKSTIMETVARRLYLHVQQVGLEVKGRCLVGHRHVHHRGNSGKAAVPACSAGGFGSEGLLFTRCGQNKVLAKLLINVNCGHICVEV